MVEGPEIEAATFDKNKFLSLKVNFVFTTIPVLLISVILN